jgi:molybdopterin biosynthesis enzyme
MQPGKPQGFGLVGPDRTPLLALPGNPVSCYVSFELFDAAHMAIEYRYPLGLRYLAERLG